MRMQIGTFLIHRLAEVGVKHIFGVPGDFNLSFLEQIQATDDVEFIGNCNELNAAYAADGYARTSGLSALLTTFGVGDLGVIGGLAGSYAENVPVIHITGAPPLHSLNSRALIHHTLVNGDFDNIGRCMAEFTVAHARITPSNASFEIDRVLRTCWIERRPVHLELPSDVTHIEIDIPNIPLVLADPVSDPEQLKIASQRIVQALGAAHSPAILVDVDADRFGVTDLIMKLAEKCGIPYATLPPAKSALDETSAHYIGTYAGAGSAPSVRATIENADCLIGVGLRFTDGSTALFSQQINPETLIDLRRHDLNIGTRPMPGVMLRDILAKILEEVEPVKPINRPRTRQDTPVNDNRKSIATCSEGTLTHATLWPHIQDFLKPDDVIFGEMGTAYASLSSMKLPVGVTYITQPIWGAIGYTLPALLGSLVGASSRRHLLFIGDGSFQLTAQELSSILRLNLKPIIFLLNNAGYTIERLILGENSTYNDVANWRYTELPHAFDRHDRALSFVVETVPELDAALTCAEVAECLVFIEVKLPKMDSPESLKSFGKLFADFDYGERGPQHALVTP